MEIGEFFLFYGMVIYVERGVIMYEHMQNYLGLDIYPFHMPGHKGNPMFFPQGLTNLDLTEIPGMDVLHRPDGIILEFQDAIASFYCADKSYLLVNGSTAGIVAAICATCNEGQKIYAARNGHVSMYNAIAMAGAEPIYLMPEITPDGLSGGIVLDEIEEGAVVFIVSPTYEGFVSDIKTIADKVHSRGGLLIVDEAHGAHFRFHDYFPESALDLGADIVVQSFHKTLPALGQMAVLHVKGDRIDVGRMEYFLQVMQTTSPSYMMMGQLSYVLNMLWKRPEIFETYVNRLKGLRMALAANEVQAISLTGRERIGMHGIYDIDLSKLLFRVNVYEKAEAISAMLASQYRVQLEMARGFHMLGMTTVADIDEGFQRMWGAIGSMNIKLEEGLEAKAEKLSPVISRFDPEIVMSPSAAIYQDTEVVAWEQAHGRIAAEVVAAYPPGVAIVAPGERIPEGLPKLSDKIRVIR